MKMIRNLKLSLIIAVVVFTFSLAVEVKHRKNKATTKSRPNIGDLNSQIKTIKPFIEKPFLPQEVDRLSEPKRKTFDDTSMTSAILLGPSPSKGGLDENPSMYSTVIERHATSIVHPIPQPLNYALHPQAAQAFHVSQQEIQTQAAKLTPGAYSIPVKIQGGAINDPTLSGYETPNFIHMKEKQIPAQGVHPQSDTQHVNPEVDMKNSINHDIQTFVAQFDNAHDKQERTNILVEGKKRLSNEAKALSAEIEADLKELLFAKEVAIKMRNLMANYEGKMRKEELSKLKLADEVTIKNLLRDKLQRELQGFRTSSQEYKELEVVNPSDITKIIHDIRLKIGE